MIQPLFRELIRVILSFACINISGNFDGNSLLTLITKRWRSPALFLLIVSIYKWHFVLFCRKFFHFYLQRGIMSSCSLCWTTTGSFETAAEALNVLHVSSAYMSTVDNETAWGRSFKKMINSNGPKTDSWKTPCVISLCCACSPSITTDYLLPFN